MVDSYKTLHSKKESVYATDAAPTPAANAVPTRNFTAKPIETDRLARNLDRPVRGRSKDATTNERGTLSYELELSGSGVAGTAAPFMEHFEACGMAAPVLTANTSAVQRFAAIGAALSSMTHYHWHGTQRRRSIGARGTFGMNFTAGAYPFANLAMTALIPAVTPIDDNTPGVADFSRWIEPVEVNTRNTDFTLDGYAAVLRSFVVTVNAEITPRNLVGSNYIHRGNHAATCQIVCEAPLIATKNYFQTLRTGAEIAAQLIHGLDAGNILQVDAPHLQLTDIDLQEENDVLMLSISAGLNVGSVPDDLILTAK